MAQTTLEIKIVSDGVIGAASCILDEVAVALTPSRDLSSWGATKQVDVCGPIHYEASVCSFPGTSWRIEIFEESQPAVVLHRGHLAQDAYRSSVCGEYVLS
jgi:hypothetical protein